jgi:hypothetical protein
MTGSRCVFLLLRVLRMSTDGVQAGNGRDYSAGDAAALLRLPRGRVASRLCRPTKPVTAALTTALFSPALPSTPLNSPAIPNSPPLRGVYRSGPARTLAPAYLHWLIYGSKLRRERAQKTAVSSGRTRTQTGLF